MTTLPIQKIADLMSSAIKIHRLVILSCPTGSGKTLFVGQSLLDERGSGRIFHTVPRVLIAKGARDGVKKLFNKSAGVITGRFIEQGKEPLVFMTEGSFLNKHFLLKKEDILIVDEVHEQGVLCTLVLAVAKRHFENGGRVIIMSATMFADKYLNYFKGGVVLTLPEVERPYTTEVVEVASLEEAVQQASSQPGPVLFGFPGKKDIEEFAANCKRQNIPVFQLHGEQEDWEQEETIAALRRGDRCFVAATSVAMSGVTLPNLRAVVPPVYGKQIVDGKLTEYVLSTAEAKQWEGRVGRLSPGVVYRLQGVERPEWPLPEIQRVEALDIVLQIKSFGLEAEDLIDRPSPQAVEKATRILTAAGLLDAGNITTLGQRVVAEGQSVASGLLAVIGDDLGIGCTARKLAAVHNAGSPFRKSCWHQRHTRANHSSWLFSDHMMVVIAVESEELVLSREFLETHGIFGRGVKALRRDFKEIKKSHVDQCQATPDLVKKLLAKQLPSLIFEDGRNDWQRAITRYGKVFATLAPVVLKRGQLPDMETCLD